MKNLGLYRSEFKIWDFGFEKAKNQTLNSLRYNCKLVIKVISPLLGCGAILAGRHLGTGTAALGMLFAILQLPIVIDDHPLFHFIQLPVV